MISKVIAKFPVGSATYNAIAALWTTTFIAQACDSFLHAVTDMALGEADPTGLYSVFTAFNLPMCGSHSPFPY